MRWSYSIGRIAGTEIKVHVTFVLLLAWLAFQAYGVGGAAAALDRSIFVLALFACVTLHEFGHILVARRFGVHTPDVLLLPIGGVARLERIPDEPRQELAIALGGPAVTVAIAVLFYGYLRATGFAGPFLPTDANAGPFALRLMVVNVVLLVFNLIPAFPMDGGRVLRSLLATRLGLVRATRVAAAVGQTLAVGMGLVGLTPYGSPLLVLIAFFVFIGAAAEASAVETRAAAQGLKVAQVMVTQFRTIPVHATLAHAVDLLLSGEQREFPVVDNLGRTEGLLTRENLIRGLKERGTESTVADAMTTPAPAVSPSTPFQEALDRLRASGLPALPVVDAAGALVGLLTLENISELLLIRRAAAR